MIKRTLPHSPEAEKSVIGSMIMDREAILAAAEILRGEDFYQSQYGIIFDTIVELCNEGRPVDLVTLQERLREKGLPEEISDMEYARDLLDAVPTSANIRYYAQIVGDKALLRRLIKACGEVSDSCYLQQEGTDAILETSEKKMFELFQRKDVSDYVPIRQIVLNVVDNIEKASRTQGNVTGLATGFVDLDYKTSGFQPSDLILIAARPSMGKTAFALNIARHMAFKGGATVAIFSLEMSKEQLVSRMLSMESRVDSQSLRTGDLRDEDWTKLVEGADVIGRSNLIIDDTPGITVAALRSKCRKYKLEHDLGIIFIDYLQLMSGSGRGGNVALGDMELLRRRGRRCGRLGPLRHRPVHLLGQAKAACLHRTDVPRDAACGLFHLWHHHHQERCGNPCQRGRAGRRLRHEGLPGP